MERRRGAAEAEIEADLVGRRRCDSKEDDEEEQQLRRRRDNALVVLDELRRRMRLALRKRGLTTAGGSVRAKFGRLVEAVLAEERGRRTVDTTTTGRRQALAYRTLAEMRYSGRLFADLKRLLRNADTCYVEYRIVTRPCRLHDLPSCTVAYRLPSNDAGEATALPADQNDVEQGSVDIGDGCSADEQTYGAVELFGLLDATLEAMRRTQQELETAKTLIWSSGRPPEMAELIKEMRLIEGELAALRHRVGHLRQSENYNELLSMRHGDALLLERRRRGGRLLRRPQFVEYLNRVMAKICTKNRKK